MTRIAAPFILGVSLLLAFAGCRSVAPAIAGLSTTLADVTRDSAGRLEATVRVANPNLAAYNIASSEHRVYLDGRLVGEIAIEQPMGVPPQNMVTRQAEIELGKDAGDVVAAALARGSAAFRLESSVVIQIYGDRRETFRTQSTGTVPVAARP